MVVGYWHRATTRAINDGYGRAPVALSGNTPVTEPEVHRTLPQSSLRQFGYDRVERRLEVEPIKLPGLHQWATGKISALFEISGFLDGITHDLNDGEPVLLREFPVSLIVRRD